MSKEAEADSAQQKQDADKRSSRIGFLIAVNVLAATYAGLAFLATAVDSFPAFRGRRIDHFTATLSLLALTVTILLILSISGLLKRKLWGRLVNLVLAFCVLAVAALFFFLPLLFDDNGLKALLPPTWSDVGSGMLFRAAAFFQLGYAVFVLEVLLPAKTREMFH